MTDTKEPIPEDIRLQLERILRSPKFKGSFKQSKFLKFVVQKTMEGRSDQLKGYTIALEVYGRKDSFDPQVDPIVRVEAGRLRRALEHYYLTVGQNDPVRIDIPKGGYVPSFQALGPPSSSNKTPSRTDADSALPSGPSIAVMPLVNLSGDQEQDYFADGLTEELTVELARFQELRVIASQSTKRFKGLPLGPLEAANELGVRFLITGSVRKDINTVKVTIKLLDCFNNSRIWGKSYKRELTAANLIALQEDIAHRAVGAIADHYGFITRILSKDSRKKAPKHFEAYDAVLSFYHYESQLTPQSFKNALSALEQAVEIDPDYGLAWAMLGHLHADNYALGFCRIEDPLKKSLKYAQKGVALAPVDQFVQDALTLVYFHRGDKKQFLKHVQETIELNPNAPYIIGVAGWHMSLFGEWEIGLKLLSKGMKLNPYYPSWFHLATFVDFYRRDDYENAYAEALKFNYPGLFWDPIMRAAALGQIGRTQEAKRALNNLLELVPNFTEDGPDLIGRYVKVDDLIDKVMVGLRKAGLAYSA